MKLNYIYMASMSPIVTLQLSLEVTGHVLGVLSGAGVLINLLYMARILNFSANGLMV